MNTQFECHNRPLPRTYNRHADQAILAPSLSWAFRLLLLFALVTAMLTSMPAFAQTAPSLGTAANFGVLGGSTVTNTGATTITGDLGVSPGTAITGFPPGTVIGTIHTANATAQQAQSDALTAYNALVGQACGTNLTGQDLGGLTLTPGVYCFSSSAQLTGILTLDALGDPDAVFIFQIGTTLITSSGSSVRVINGGQNCNVFFGVGSSATLGSTTSFAGNILAVSSITLNTGASMAGRALARTGAVTLDTNSVNASLAACGTPPQPPLVPPAPQSIVCPPGGLTSGGASGVGTVSLSGPAPAGGVVVTLTSSAPGTASVPLSIVIPAGSTSASFTVTPGAGSGPVTITATTAGGTVECSFVVEATTPPPAPQSIVCPSGGLISGGSSGVGTVTLTGPAPAGGVVVTLTSSAPGTATVPSSIVIPAGSTSASFNVTPLAGSGLVTITATTARGTVACSFAVVAATAVPALDYVGLAIMLMLLAGTALFAMNRFN